MTNSTDMKRLYKSRTDRMIDGICGGIAEYFGLDSTLVRIAWVLLTILGGAGILIYIIAMIVMPVNPVVAAPPVQQKQSGANHKFWGVLFIVVGALWLLSNFGFSIWHDWWNFSWGVILPLILILAGVAFMFGGRNYVSSPAASPETAGGEPAQTPVEPVTPRVSRLYRSKLDRKMFGICGGLGEYFRIDSTIVRILFVISAFASFGVTLLLYVIMAFIVPEEPIVSQA